ncbi:WecB/TagA/CpsF family glycosyltransferase [Candidatus Falkowbacteria bacterium]|nr:WecB/TagA/CpsF family glycosyltransferase [Candidatus Falkowbacteria bacterium]
MPEIYILGAKINDVSLNEAMNLIADFLITKKKGFVVTPNPEICLISYKDKIFRRIIQNSFLSIPDGSGLKLGSRILGDELNNKTTGADLSQKILELAEQKNYSILILGGKQEIGEKALQNIKCKYPNLKIYYLNGGTFDNLGYSNDANLVEKINQINPDIICIMLGAPKQEYFMSANLDKLNAKLMLGLGGTIDFLAGQIIRAPEKLRKMGLEWLWRLYIEPWRWKRIINAVIIFPITCFIYKHQKHE